MSRFRYRIGMRKVAGVQLLVILLIVLIVWQIGGLYKAALILAGALNYLLPSLAGYYLMVSLNRLFQAAPLFSLFIEANRVLLIVVLMVMSYFLYAKVAWIFYLAGLLIALIIQAAGFLILEKFCHE